jgi:hypothetical protein
MSSEIVHLALLVTAWVVAFLLGKELQHGFHEWCRRRAEQPVRDDD